MRFVHLSDLHWQTAPTLRDLPGKRILGTANLYLRGRRRHFSAETADAAVRAAWALAPDAVVISGDLTAQALKAEFVRAKEALRPMISALPSLVVPGNHDVYTLGSTRERRFELYFGEWCQPEPLSRLDTPAAVFLGLHASRPGVLASGVLPDPQLEALRRTLETPDSQGRPLFLVIHHPVVGRDAGLYTKATHGLRNAERLWAILDGAAWRPAAILSGHVHLGYVASRALSWGTLPQFVAGAGGQVPHDGRTATFLLYTTDSAGLLRAERYSLGSEGFEADGVVWRRPAT